MKSTRHWPRRLAFTLVEITAVIALLSIVLGAVGVLLNGAWRIQRSMSHDRVVFDSIGRLARQFRDDAHEAETATAATVARSQRLTLTMRNGMRLEYQSGEETIERFVFRDDQVAEREAFAIPSGAKVAWQIDNSAGRKIVSLILSSPLDSTAPEFADRRELRVDAALGSVPPELSLKTRP